MGFLDGFAQSWRLVRISWDVMMRDKELLLFPVLSALGVVVMSLLVFFPALFAGADQSVWWFLLWYFLASFIVIFHNAAIVACVRKRLHGGDPTIGYGYTEAGKRITQILGWSLVSASVGLVLRALERMAQERDNFLAQIAVSILGAAWGVITYFVIPIVIVEGVGAFGAIRRSGSLVRKTWGEQVTAVASVGLAFFLGWLALIGIGFLALYAGVFSLGLLVVLVVLGVALAIVQSALGAVLTSVLYSYATGDNVPIDVKQAAGSVATSRR